MLIGGLLLLVAVVCIVVISYKIKNMTIKVLLILGIAALTFPFWGYLVSLLLGAYK